MSEGGRFVSPMTREALPPDLAPAEQQREAAATNPNPNPNPNPDPNPSPDPNPNPDPNQAAATFRRERAAAMLAFAEEAAGLDGRQEMAMSVVDRVAEYTSPTSLHLPYTSPTPPLHLPYTSPTPPLHLPYTSPTSPLHLPGTSRPCPPRRWCPSQAP